MRRSTTERLLKDPDMLNRYRHLIPRGPLSEAQKLLIGEKNTRYRFSPPDVLTPDIAFLIGAYLSDGHINKKGHTFEYSSVDRESIDNLNAVVSRVVPNQHTHISFRPVGKDTKRKQDIFRLTVLNKELCCWLLRETGRKDHIPAVVFDLGRECQLSTLSALFDGDGSAHSGGVYIASSFGWLPDAYRLLHQLMIPSRVRVQQILPGDRPYLRIDIRKSDFLASGIRFTIHRKRLVHGF